MIHTGCNGTVLVDVTSSYKLLAQVVQDKKGTGLRTTEIHVYNTKEECSGLVFWCVKCDEEVSLADVRVSCRICGESLTVEDGLVPIDTGGIWCGSCLESRCDDEETVSLQSIYDNNLVALT